VRCTFVQNPPNFWGRTPGLAGVALPSGFAYNEVRPEVRAILLRFTPCEQIQMTKHVSNMPETSNLQIPRATQILARQAGPEGSG
jgi:hypothetical protein